MTDPRRLLLPPPPSIDARTAVLQCTQADAPLDGPPCDIRSITLSFNEIEAGSQDAVGFSTFTASADRASLRPRDRPVPDSTPERFKGWLAEHDLVVEVLASEIGRLILRSDAQSPSAHGQADRKREMPRLKPQPSTVVTTTGVWKASCGDPRHAELEMTWDMRDADDRVWPAGMKGDGTLSPIHGVTISRAVPCRPAMAHDLDLKGFVRSVIHPEALAKEYRFAGTSCGRPAAGVDTTRLSALVIAYPMGLRGIELGVGPFSWEIGWGFHEAQEKRAEAREDDAAERARLQTIVDGKGAGSRPSKPGKAASRAARAKFKSEAKAANAARADARADLASLRPPPDSILSTDYWSEGEQDVEGFDMTIFLQDRVLGLQEILAGWSRGTEVLHTLKAIFRSAESLKDQLMRAFAFISDYSPSLVRPVARLDVQFLGLEVFLGYKLSSEDGLKTERWRGLEPYWDADIAGKVVDVSGSLGITVGERLVGTGLTLEVLVTLGGDLAVDYEIKGRAVSFPPPNRASEIKGLGSLILKASLLGRATLFWCDVAVGGGELTSGVDCIATCHDVEAMFTSNGWEHRMVGAPIVGMAYYQVLHGKRRYLSYTLWKGSEPRDGDEHRSADAA